MWTYAEHTVYFDAAQLCYLSLVKCDYLLYNLLFFVATTPPTTTSTRAPPSTPNPSSVYVRLAGGNSAYEGRVEVYAFGKWGTICDDDWNSTDAGVICNMLGYSK